MNAKETLRFIEQITNTERKRITDWIESNRRYIEIDAGIGIYRDSFNSEDLLKFINGEDYEATT